MKKLSVSLIAHNEEDTLKDCLESVNWADEIIVVDCASTDNTEKIARQYTSRIFSRPNLANLNLNKQYGLEQTGGDWILYLDPDERVSPLLKEEILGILQEEDNSYQGYFISRRNYYLGHWLKRGGKYPDRQLRLFEKGKGKFPGQHVHEYLKIDGRVGKIKGYLEHHPYPTTNELLRKLIFYTDFQTDYLLKRGVRPNLITFWQYLIWRPVTRFIRRFIFKLGFLDGFWGLVGCLHDIFTDVITYIKLKEKSEKK